MAAIPGAAQIAGERPNPAPAGVTVLNPRGRVPVSLIIDDSTCLVNLAHYCIPHFAEAFPEGYQQDWRALPREIPDSFVRKFAEWCHGHGVKGKYSIVPNPACVGWMDRGIAGWSRKELEASLALVRSAIMPDWDIHPEMVTHTWVIDTKTGRPLPGRTARQMENFGWTEGRSADELADYMGYALRILKNAGLECEGVTTPGGFASRVLPQLSQATLQACRDVFRAEIPHYFRHALLDTRSVEPRVENVSGLETADPRCVVSIVSCTGDWFGGWDGLGTGSADRLITADGAGGRMPEVIRRGEPAIMMCHWPGIYYNGTESGFQILQQVVGRLHETFDNLIWMKLSEIARYWAAKELTRIEGGRGAILLRAPYACPGFTMRVPLAGPPRLRAGAEETPLRAVTGERQLVPGTFFRDRASTVACFDLPKGESTLLA